MNTVLIVVLWGIVVFEAMAIVNCVLEFYKRHLERKLKQLKIEHENIVYAREATDHSLDAGCWCNPYLRKDPATGQIYIIHRSRHELEETARGAEKFVEDIKEYLEGTKRCAD